MYEYQLVILHINQLRMNICSVIRISIKDVWVSIKASAYQSRTYEYQLIFILISGWGGVHWPRHVCLHNVTGSVLGWSSVRITAFALVLLYNSHNRKTTSCQQSSINTSSIQIFSKQFMFALAVVLSETDFTVENEILFI